MLLTIEQEAKRQRVQMPSPERIKKVNICFKTLDKFLFMLFRSFMCAVAVIYNISV